MTDFTSHDKEQSGMELVSEHALGRFELLMGYVKRRDVKNVKRFINVDDFAKISAIESIYGSNHSTAGDNLKYLYDFSTGRFRLILRVESAVELAGYTDNLTQFDQVIPNSTGYKNKWNLQLIVEK